MEEKSTELPVKEPRVNFPRVLPSIDPDKYQADVPEWCPPKEELESDLPERGLHSRSVHSPGYDSNLDVQEYLATVRNLLDPFRPSGQHFWAASQSANPLTTDEDSLEYLASYSYDVEKALFCLFCELGQDKDRTDSNVIFRDCKDRLLRVPPQAMFGAYYAAFNQGRLPCADAIPPTSSGTPSSNLSAAVRWASLVSVLTTGHTSRGTVQQAGTSSAAGQVIPSQQRVIVSSIISYPMQQADCEKLISAASRLSPFSEILPLKDPKWSSGDIEDEEVQVELRKKWLQVAQKASALLHRGTLTAAQAVLEQACALPPYSNNVSSTSAANTSEAELLHNVGTILGNLAKATVLARFWLSEVRDAVYCCSLDALIHTGQNDVRNKSKKGNAESLMNGLRELLKESEALQVYAEPEERQLRQTVEATRDLLVQTRRVLRECCAWEQNFSSTDALAKFESTAVTASATHKHVRVLCGRSEVYTAAKVRSLLHAHINQGTETFGASSVERRPSMEEVGELLVRAAENPVKISEMVYLEDLHHRGLQLVDTASTILVRASQLSVAKSRLTLDRVRYTVQEVQGLLRRMHSFPFRSREVDMLQALVLRAEAWRKEVVTMSGGILSNRGSSSWRSDAAASAASNKPVPLKKVQALIAEGERFPFEYKKELEVLKELVKKDPTKLWLEKLKRSLVPTNVNPGRSKGGEKLSLSDMKLMLSEGKSLYQQLREDDAASSCTVKRELARAQAVMVTAEDWISRVRDLLMGGGDDESKGEEGEDSPELTIQALRKMLQEAEGMPVTLDECGLLRCHLQALEWAAKVRPLLNAPAAVASSSSGADKLVAASAMCTRDNSNKNAAGKQQKVPGKPRLAEMQQFAKEISRIRASASSASSSSDIPLKALPEEVRCLSLVWDAEKWLNKAKKLMQGSAVRRGTELSQLRSLHEEGAQIPINFETELLPLKAAIAAEKEEEEEEEQEEGEKEEEEYWGMEALSITNTVEGEEGNGTDDTGDNDGDDEDGDEDENDTEDEEQTRRAGRKQPLQSAFASSSSSVSSASMPPQKKARMATVTVTAALDAEAEATPPTTQLPPLFGNAGNEKDVENKDIIVYLLRQPYTSSSRVSQHLTALRWKIVRTKSDSYVVSPPGDKKRSEPNPRPTTQSKTKEQFDQDGLVEGEDYFEESEEGKRALFKFLRGKLGLPEPKERHAPAGFSASGRPLRAHKK